MQTRRAEMNQMLYDSMFLLIGTFISAISQVLLKKSAMKTYSSRIREYLNPQVITAYVIFVISTFLSILAYRGIPLSLGAVLETTSYVYVTWFGVKIFHERISFRKFASLALIIGGIIVYSLLG